MLRSWRSNDVEFVVVGGVGAVMHGAPVSTFDLDIVHARSDKNVCRLLLALTRLDAIYRGQGSRILRPDARALLSPGHQLLSTNAGPLDILGQVGAGRTFNDLLPNTVEIEVDGATDIRVVDLKTLIEIKREVGRPKDLAQLPTLEAALAELGDPHDPP